MSTAANPAISDAELSVHDLITIGIPAAVVFQLTVFG
jgi:hypothetical protein